jgi:hypothetical protein
MRDVDRYRVDLGCYVMWQKRLPQLWGRRFIVLLLWTELVVLDEFSLDQTENSFCTQLF